MHQKEPFKVLFIFVGISLASLSRTYVERSIDQVQGSSFHCHLLSLSKPKREWVSKCLLYWSGCYLRGIIYVIVVELRQSEHIKTHKICGFLVFKTPRIENPYHNGFNELPETSAGRDEVLESIIDALEVAAVCLSQE